MAEASRGELARQIIRSTGIIAGSSVANTIISLFRTKVAALILGPAGIGVAGLAQSLITTASSFAGFGIGNIGTRQIAEATNDSAALKAARQAVAVAAIVLAALGAIIVFLARSLIARWIFHDPSWSPAVGWLSLGVALVVGSTAQNGVLTGMRRIGDLARVSVVSALIASIIGIGALLAWQMKALLLYILVSPLVTFLVGGLYLAKLPRPRVPPVGISDLSAHWKVLGRLGFAFTMGALAITGGQLAVRSLVQAKLGEIPLGQYQAAWMISMNYIGVILTALATDYYPRLTAVIREPGQARAAVEQQLEIALLLAGPVLIGTTALGDWLIPLLYSSRFAPAVEVLRWQILGDLFKIASWPMGFILLAAGRGRAFIMADGTASALMVTTTVLLLPRSGIAAPAIAYFTMYVFFTVLMLVLAHRILDYRPGTAVVRLFAFLAAALIVTDGAAQASPVAAAAIGTPLAAGAAWYSARHLHHALPPSLAALVGWIPGVRNGAPQ